MNLSILLMVVALAAPWSSVEGRIGSEAKEIDFPMEKRPCM